MAPSVRIQRAKKSREFCHVGYNSQVLWLKLIKKVISFFFKEKIKMGKIKIGPKFKLVKLNEILNSLIPKFFLQFSSILSSTQTKFARFH